MLIIQLVTQGANKTWLQESVGNSLLKQPHLIKQQVYIPQ